MMIRVRIKATGQVLDMVPAAAAEKLNCGMAEIVPVVEERETFGGVVGRAVQTATKYLAAR